MSVPVKLECFHMPQTRKKLFKIDSNWWKVEQFSIAFSIENENLNELQKPYVDQSSNKLIYYIRNLECTPT